MSLKKFSLKIIIFFTLITVLNLDEQAKVLKMFLVLTINYNFNLNKEL